ncbi:MAG: undecaprenyl/decaprenyl-phosphate alpha-N-acetylglucosaminyl 1-phosphate transferase [Lentisphaeria bacterium]|nr:undecaprenyl/decaprenyl-phosphate alpha-N-acetylglucosaminyl 1-phosphate transferase [Lentisphaeria bacterium]
MYNDPWIKIYAIIFISGLAATLILTPVFRRIARTTGFMDVPAANHKGHKKSTPLLGGIAMFCAWILCIVAGFFTVKYDLIPFFTCVTGEHLAGLHHVSRELFLVVGGALLAVLLGLIDDKYPMSARTKFAGQFLVALIAVFGGGVRFNIFPETPGIEIPLTIFWIMLLMNSINFFDNMDGLAVGTIAIAMGFFAVIAILNSQYFMASFTILNCAVCCGFWFYNASPATIFMGDSGSHFLGYLAAVVSAQVTFFDKSFSLSRFPVLMPLFILALPLFDTAMVVIIRTLNRKPFWIGDHNHISHRFVRMGFSRKRAVMLVHLLALTFGLGILPVFWGNFATAAILVIQAVLMLGIITFLQLSLSERPDARE